MPAPVERTKSSGWLYTWARGIQKASKKSDNAWKFVSWASGKEYESLVGETSGWANVPAGKRASTYDNPEYRKSAGAFADVTEQAIAGADPLNPGTQPRPTAGIQFVGIPEFTDLGTKVAQEISAAIAGRQSVDKALATHFHLQDTATFRLPDRSAEAARFGAVYVGGLAAVVEPAAGTVRATALAAAGHSPLVVDPNVRENPTAAGDGGLDALRELCALAHVVKVSDEDMAWLRPDTAPADACRRPADGGRRVVLTRGALDSTAYIPGTGPVSVPAAPVDVVSTIGAGDAFVAAMLAWLGDRRGDRRTAGPRRPPARRIYGRAYGPMRCAPGHE